MSMALELGQLVRVRVSDELVSDLARLVMARIRDRARNVLAAVVTYLLTMRRYKVEWRANRDGYVVVIHGIKRSEECDPAYAAFSELRIGADYRDLLNELHHVVGNNGSVDDKGFWHLNVLIVTKTSIEEITWVMFVEPDVKKRECRVEFMGWFTALEVEVGPGLEHLVRPGSEFVSKVLDLAKDLRSRTKDFTIHRVDDGHMYIIDNEVGEPIYVVDETWELHAVEMETEGDEGMENVDPRAGAALLVMALLAMAYPSIKALAEFLNKRGIEPETLRKAMSEEGSDKKKKG